MPAFFIPGTTVDSFFMVHASMWDVRNQYLYLSVETEGMVNEILPAFLIQEDRVVKEAKTEALTRLSKDISVRLERMGKP